MSDRSEPFNLRHLRQKQHLVEQGRTVIAPTGPSGRRRGFRRYKVSSVGQMTLSADARRRWGVELGGEVEVADLGFAVLVVPLGGSAALLDLWLSDDALEREAQDLLSKAEGQR